MAIAATAPAGSMSAPLWRGVDAIVIDCSGDAQLCRAAVVEAGRSAPIPITASSSQSPPDAIGTLILTVRLIADGQDRFVEISARRAVMIDESQGELLPKRFALPTPSSTSDFAAVIRLALDRTLPWRSALNQES